MLDCRDLSSKPVKIDLQDCTLLIIDSHKQRSLARSGYAQRRKECQIALDYFQSKNPDVKSLGDVQLPLLEDAITAQALKPPVSHRVRHVINENLRVQASVDAIGLGKLDVLGSLMFESHVSLKEDYEVSCRELDFLVDTVMTLPGGIGARLTGAGFGGCTINLVKTDQIEAIKAHVLESYLENYGVQPSFYQTRPSAGAQVVWTG